MVVGGWVVVVSVYKPILVISLSLSQAEKYLTLGTVLNMTFKIVTTLWIFWQIMKFIASHISSNKQYVFKMSSICSAEITPVLLPFLTTKLAAKALIW